MKYSIINSSLAIALTASCSLAFAEPKQITISEEAAYYDAKVIPSNIKSECTGLGRQFSESTQNYLSQSGAQISRAADIPKEGYGIELLIVNASSTGNAWSGHRKSVSIEANLFLNGELVDTYQGTRNSGGGFGAGFKGSCEVLRRCVNTLGKDVSKWVKNKAL